MAVVNLSSSEGKPTKDQFITENTFTANNEEEARSLNIHCILSFKRVTTFVGCRIAGNLISTTSFKLIIIWQRARDHQREWPSLKGYT